MASKTNKKALVLFSGGLDSMLAVKLLQNQKVAVTALTFKSAFWEIAKTRKSAKSIGVSLKIVNFSKKHLAMVKKPKHGYGAAANPCLDCHLLMLKSASVYISTPPGCHKLTPKEKYDFVATGEVLGQRPFSQNKKALSWLAKESGLNGLLLRPLSARLLPETEPEKNGWVNRSKLLAIEGRGRSFQIALARKFGLSDYPQPAGGCLLTDKIFGAKLKKIFQKWPGCTTHDIQLLRLGRHFWKGKTLIVLGRNREENEKLKKLKRENDSLIKPNNFPGPTALVRGEGGKGMMALAKKRILDYSSETPKEAKFMVE